MQRIQISRGSISVRQGALPLIPGEYHLDNTEKGNYKLYIGVNADGKNYEYASHVLTNELGEVVAGPDGSYAQVGTSGVLGIKSVINSFVEATPTTGSLYIVGKDIQLSPEEVEKFMFLVSDGIEPGSTAELKKGDIILFDGAKWIKVGGGASTAKDVSFYPTHSNATVGTDSVQDAIFALDSSKIQFAGELSIPVDFKGAVLTKTAGGIPTLTGPEPENTVIKAFGERTNWADIEGNLYSIPNECTIDGIKYEMGDFLIVTASKKWSERTTEGNPNTRILDAADVTFNRMQGGTHDPAKIYITKADGLTRPEQGEAVYSTSDAENIHNVKDALGVLFGTKADVDPATGKILLSELPSTIIGAMDYQGTHDTATVPTSADKAINPDVGDHNKEVELIKGDYWVYAGEDWDITDVAEINGKGAASGDGKYYLTKGDWIVYNGTSFDVVDNTDSFIGIKAAGSAESSLSGVVNLEGNKRTIKETQVSEVEVTQDSLSNSITIATPNAIIQPEPIPANTIIKVDGDKNAYATGLTEDAGKLTITEANGVTLSDGTHSANITTNTNENPVDITLPGKSGTLATQNDIGLENGTDFFAAMFRSEEGQKVLRDSFLKFLGSTNPAGKLDLTGIQLKSETDTKQVDILLSNDTDPNTQILPRSSGYLLNSNSIIDCGVWDGDHPQGYMPREGHVHADNINRELVNTVDYNENSDNSTPPEIIEAFVVE